MSTTADITAIARRLTKARRGLLRVACARPESGTQYDVAVFVYGSSQQRMANAMCKDGLLARNPWGVFATALGRAVDAYLIARSVPRPDIAAQLEGEPPSTAEYIERSDHTLDGK